MDTIIIITTANNVVSDLLNFNTAVSMTLIPEDLILQDDSRIAQSKAQYQCSVGLISWL